MIDGNMTEKSSSEWSIVATRLKWTFSWILDFLISLCFRNTVFNPALHMMIGKVRFEGSDVLVESFGTVSEAAFIDHDPWNRSSGSWVNLFMFGSVGVVLKIHLQAC